jgi:hypothetical protein
MKTQQQMLLDEAVLGFAQKLSVKPKIVYSVKDSIPFVGSIRTAYRRLNVLTSLGIAKKAKKMRGNFIMNSVLSSQPITIVQKLLPSLIAIKNGRRFGKYYNKSDINFILNNMSEKLMTLDYKAWELTRLQTPLDLYIYAKNMDKTVSFLKNNRFSEGKKGHIVFLPMIGNFDNDIERTYLDCIAKGGRSIQDAIAIELIYGNRLTIKANFSIDAITKVQQELPTNKK